MNFFLANMSIVLKSRNILVFLGSKNVGRGSPESFICDYLVISAIIRLYRRLVEFISDKTFSAKNDPPIRTIFTHN